MIFKSPVSVIAIGAETLIPQFAITTIWIHTHRATHQETRIYAGPVILFLEVFAYYRAKSFDKKWMIIGRRSSLYFLCTHLLNQQHAKHKKSISDCFCIILGGTHYRQINYLLGQLIAIFNIQFMQGLNVLVDKRNRYENKLIQSLFYIALSD